MLPQAEVAVPSLIRGGNLLDQVRWGTNGFAFRTDRDLLVSLRSSIVAPGLASLGLSIEGPESAIYSQPVEFSLIVTNRGSAPSLPFQLTARALGGRDLTFPGRLPPTQGDAILLVRDPIPPGGTRALTLQTTPANPPFPTGFLTIEVAITLAGGDIVTTAPPVSKAISTRLVQADLAISLGPPLSSGDLEKTILCTLSNRGPETVLQPAFQVEFSRGLTLLDVDKGTVDYQCCSPPIVHELTPTLSAGQSIQVNLRFRTAGPGNYSLRVVPNLLHVDPLPSDNIARVGVDVPASNGTATFPSFNLPYLDAVWSTARNQWIAVQETGLTLLDPVSLAPKGFFSFPYWGADFHLADGDQSVWIATDNRNATRYGLETGTVEQTVQSHLTTGAAFGTIIPIPGHPELLVIAGLDESGQMEAVAFSNGQLLPAKYSGDLQWTGARTTGTATADLRVYISNGVGFRELELQADGLHLRRNLDGFEPGVDYIMAAARGLLAPDFKPEDIRYIKSIPATALNHPGPSLIGYEVYHSESGTRIIQSIDLRTGHVLWERPVGDGTGRQIAGGPGGALLLGDAGGWLPAPDNAGTDLRLRATLESSPLGVGNEFTIQLQLRQTGIWRAANLRLKADLPAGVSIVSPTDLPVDGTIPLPDFNPDLSVPIVLRAVAAGTHIVRFRLESDSQDPTPGDTTADLTVVVPEEPVLLLPDQIGSDNGSPLRFRLSGRAPRFIKVQLQAELTDAQLNDVAGLVYELDFPTGTQELRIPWIAPDTRMEPEEHFRIRWIAGDVPARPETALITIANDDAATLQVRSVTQVEGNKASGANAVILFQLNEAPAMPVEFSFRTRDGTASAGEDYKPVQGTVLISPGQRTNAVVIPIIGDLLWEPTESFTLDLSDSVRVTLPSFPATVTLQNDDLPIAPALTMSSDAGGQILLQFQGQLGVPYVLQSAEDLAQGTWVPEPEPILGTGTSQTLRVDSSSFTQRYFRLVAF